MIVLDSSTLILLAKCDLLPLLAEKTPLAIPPEVESEVLVKPELYDAQTIAAAIRQDKIKVIKPKHAHDRKRIEADFGLDSGEAAALILAQEKGVPVGTDDWPAIKAAKIMGIPFLTAVHVLLELHLKGRISRDSALAKLERLGKVGRYNVRILDDARDRISGPR